MADGSDSSGLSEEEEQPVRDWREQIYYWRGTLAPGKGKAKLLWTGTWAGSFDGTPSAKDFENVQSFKVTGPAAAADESLPAEKGRWKGTYQMDNDGSGSTSTYKTDASFKFVAAEPGSTSHFRMAGKGSNEFGAFVIHGTYASSTKLLDTAREYIADDDPRVKLSLDELLASKNTEEPAEGASGVKRKRDDGESK